MAAQEVIRIKNSCTLMAEEAMAPDNTFKSRVFTQGSHRLKAAQPYSFQSGAPVSSHLYPWMTGNQKQLMRAYALEPVESPPPYNQKEFNGFANGEAFSVPETCEKILKEKDLQLARKRKEGNDIVGDSRLRNAGDVASPSGSSGIVGSFVETACANQDFSVKRQRLEPTVLDGDVLHGGGTLHDHGLNTDMPLQETETNMAEPKNLGLTLSRHGTKSMPTKEELEERKERIKKSKRESALRAKLRKQKEIEMLQETAEQLIRENSKLKKKLLRISEECQEVNEENESLMAELEETHGPNAISGIRARNPASGNQESNGDGESPPSDDQNREMHQ